MESPGPGDGPRVAVKAEETSDFHVQMSPGNSPHQAPPRAPRLVIKEMVLENFKSYAGSQRIGPFHKVRVDLLFFVG
jgi:hypothetical protein